MSVCRLFARAARAGAVIFFVFVPAVPAGAQGTDHSQHQQPVDHSQHQQPSGSIVDVQRTRGASGTSWLPDASPMYAVHGQHGDWELMGHGSAFLQYLNEGGHRGQSQFGSIHWVMGMASRPVSGGRLGLRGMLSLEPFTINGCGYPTLLASGEVCNGHQIVDQQHPHELFMELAAQYTRPLSATIGLELYGGLAGEPALGPVAFPHRVSALPNPIAPLSHHWLDASHISFGVLTAGVFGRQWKAEGSIFNGREPDEDRYDLDLAPPDSFSGRLWYLPTANLALQVSAAHLEEAEEDLGFGTRVDVDRVTASATWHQPLRDGGSLWASTLAWGSNRETGQWTNFVLAETNVTFDEQDAWYGRAEVGGKSAHDLDIHGSTEIFTVAKLQAGYTRYFESWKGLRPGVGATLSMSLVPSALESLYGDRAMFGFGVYVTIRPAAMLMR